MGKDQSSKREMTRKKRRLLKQRRQRVRAFLANLLAVVCAVAAALFLVVNIWPKPETDTWTVQDGQMEIAAPPLANGYGTLDILQQEATLPPIEIVQTPEPDYASAQTLPPIDAPEETPQPDYDYGMLPPLPEMYTLPPVLELEPTIAPETVSVTITAAGDCTLGGDTQSIGFERFAKVVRREGYDYFLANVRQIFESDDITIVNLEGPLTTSRDARSNRKFLFKGDPEYVKILTGSSVEVCNVANNHAKDFGSAGHKETLAVLEEAGIGASGYNVVCFQEVRGVRVGFLGLTEWDYSLSEVRSRVANMRSQCDLLIASIHWGEEGNYSATSTQKSYGRAMIDAGADLVLGHHPHVIGGVEQYKGKYIVYSLGNFCFGGNGNPSDKDTMIFRQRFDIAKDGSVMDGGIDIIPCSISSVRGSNNFQPTPLRDEAYTKLLKKIGKYSDVAEPVILSVEY